jgi:hypothetical protein
VVSAVSVQGGFQDAEQADFDAERFPQWLKPQWHGSACGAAEEGAEK